MSEMGLVLRSLAKKLLSYGSISALALAAPGIGQSTSPAFAQSAAAGACFEVVMPLNQNGKAVLVLPITVLGSEKGTSRTLVEIDPKCLGELTASGPDPKDTGPELKYNEARQAIDQVVEGLKTGMTPEVEAAMPGLADKIKNTLKAQVDNAERFKAGPAEQVGTGAQTAAQEAENSGDKEAAMLAAAGAVAAVCMAASAGICAAAVAAILPSILPSEVSSKDIAGVVRAVQSVNQGQPIGGDEIDSIIKVLNTKVKVKQEDLQTLRTFLENGPLEAVKDRLTNETGIAPEKIDKAIGVLRASVESGSLTCSQLRVAFEIEAIPVPNTALRDRIMRSVNTMRNASAVTDEVKVCLDEIFRVQ
jgi:hypothetical protein